MSAFLDSTIKVSLVLLFALAGTMVLRKRSAAMRHWVLSAAIVCAAVTPALQLVVPSWNVRLANAPSVRQVGQSSRAVVIPETPSKNAPSPMRPLTESVRTMNIARLLMALWIAGVVISLSVLLVGLARLAWLARGAERVLDGTWSELAVEVSRDFGLGRPIDLLQSDHPSLLVTWGLLRPKVMLPAGAPEWTADRIRIVLCHELAHIQRRDWVIQIVAELVRSAYWFNPLVWIACRRLRQESDQACDDAVLERGVEGSVYAAHLVDLVRALKQPSRTWLTAPAMAHASSLERRVRAMLNDRLNRVPISRSARVMTGIALLIITVTLAAAQAFATFSGSVVDPLGAIVPNARLILSNTQSGAKHEVRSNRTGQFEFVGLPPGDYLFEAQVPGFATFRQAMTMTGQNVQRGITLQLGSLEETVTITDEEAPSGAPVQARNPRAIPPCKETPSDTVQTGGNIRPPQTLRRVAPEYPQNLRGTGAEGMVTVAGRIGLDGYIRNPEVRGSAQPDFASAVLAAVSQWQWDATLLNCVPVEVSITVTARFIHQQ